LAAREAAMLEMVMQMSEVDAVARAEAIEQGQPVSSAG